MIQTVQQNAGSINVGATVTFPITLTTAPVGATAADQPGEILIAPPIGSDGTWGVGNGTETTTGFTLTWVSETVLIPDVDYHVAIAVHQKTPHNTA
jgi:hypothetical protein